MTDPGLEPLLTPWERWTRGPDRSSYLLTRFAILRLLGLVYLVAFLTAVHQGPGLLGDSGLLPIGNYAAAFDSAWNGFVAQPSLLWLWPNTTGLLVLSYLGVLLSLALLLGYANVITLLALWVLHTSIANMGQLWYAFGWEIQLLETGMLAVFLVPLWRGSPLSERAPPVVVIFLFRWLIFRIMLGAGLIKLRGDPCWDDLTCLAYHYETQPIPNPVSPWLHAMPMWFHKLGVLYNHFVELAVPVFVFGPRKVRHVAGMLMLIFQAVLILSGNLSYLNWLTIVPILACFDDSFYRRLVPRSWRAEVDERRFSAQPTRWGNWMSGGFAVLVAVMSLGPISNLFSSRQAMNTSFDRLHLVNTYGAFGSVGKARYEVV
ncbi:MAG: lipase maturation factor family protein, partial [Deltaproteobacteria bacterium]|nr:lipase maturation factor family protein [Deltaproteobacteria bacterium]